MRKMLEEAKLLDDEGGETSLVNRHMRRRRLSDAHPGVATEEAMAAGQGKPTTCGRQSLLRMIITSSMR